MIEWKKRYAAEGLDGLQDRPTSGRQPVIDEVAVVLANMEPPPERLGVTHRFPLVEKSMGGSLDVGRWAAPST